MSLSLTYIVAIRFVSICSTKSQEGEMDFVPSHSNKLDSSILTPKSLVLWFIVHCLSSWESQKLIDAIL